MRQSLKVRTPHRISHFGTLSQSLARIGPSPGEPQVVKLFLACSCGRRRRQPRWQDRNARYQCLLRVGVKFATGARVDYSKSEIRVNSWELRGKCQEDRQSN